MTPPSYWPDDDLPIVLDASAVINLNGSGAAGLILEALKQEILVAEEVIQELARGMANGRPDGDQLEELMNDGVISRRPLGDVGLTLFETLTIGPSVLTLEDGEAASIALAHETSGAAVVDETKGRRMAAKSAPTVPLIASIEFFCHPQVQRALGDGLSDALFGALRHSRMQVLASHHAWVAAVLGPKRLGLCLSLPRSIRSP